MHSMKNGSTLLAEQKNSEKQKVKYKTSAPSRHLIPSRPAGCVAYDRSPRSRRASCKSLGWMVTRLAWMAAKLVSSNRETR